MPNGHGEREALLKSAIEITRREQAKRMEASRTRVISCQEGPWAAGWAAGVLLTELETIRRRLEEVGVGKYGA